MHSLVNRVVLLLGTLFLAASVIPGVASVLTSDIVIGKWRHLKMTQTADGKTVRVQESHGETIVEFWRGGAWAMTSPQNSNSGTYRLIDEHTVETITLKSNIPNQIGWSSVKKINVNEKTLILTTIYDEKGMEAFAKRSDGTRPKEMTVTSTFERID